MLTFNIFVNVELVKLFICCINYASNEYVRFLSQDIYFTLSPFLYVPCIDVDVLISSRLV